MSFWHPRSVLQLVIGGFFAALFPLGLAVLITTQTVSQLTDKHNAVTRLVVDVTRLGQEIQRDALELERRARQYLALGDPDLADLFEQERFEMSSDLRFLQSLEGSLHSESPDIDGLLTLLSRLTITGRDLSGATVESEAYEGGEPRLEQSFTLVSERTSALHKWLQASVDQVLERNEQEADALIDNLIRQLSLSAVATVLLLLIFTYWINKPVKDLSGEIQQLGTRGLSHPIAIAGPMEIRKLGGKLEWLRQQLHDSEQQKERFLRHVSHELKTPLASLREGADLLSEHVAGHLSRQQEEIVTIVRENSIELQRLIENLVDFNQLPHRQLNMEQVQLEDLCAELLGHYRFSLLSKDLRVSTQGKVATWVADRSKLRTAVDNLLSNAVNYTPMGGSIEVTWKQKRDCLLIDVANTGEPIPQEDRELVFEPFFQSAAKRTGPIKGSGIGLSVARECMEAQQGSISLVEHDKFPVCFRLTCPAP